jgi:hypothetical protein
MKIVKKKLKVDSVKKKSAQCKQKWSNLVCRLEDIRYPEQLLDYRPIERWLGRPLTGPVDGYSREAETGHLLG